MKPLEEFTFEPAESYDGLLKQAESMATIIRGLQAVTNDLLERSLDHSEGSVAQLKQALESEKAVNKVLIQELKTLKEVAEPKPLKKVKRHSKHGC